MMQCTMPIRPISMLQRTKTVMAAMAALLLAGCVSVPTDSYCLVAHPIQPAAQDVDVISDELVEQILWHNETWGELCE